MAFLSRFPFPLRLVGFLSILVVLWLPFAVPLYLLIKNENTLKIAAMSLLAIEFFIALWLWSRRVRQQSHPFAYYGLVWQQQNGREFLEGLAIALLLLLTLFGFQSLLGWLVWQSPSPQLPRFILEGMATGLGVAFAEELFFRGWMLAEMQLDYSRNISLWVNSVIFAVLHFIRPINEIVQMSPQFVGLVLLAIALVHTKRATGRLGLPIGLHGGLVWGYYVVNIGGLVRFTGQVPEWVTGLNQNPLAGLVGLLFLGVLVTYTQKRQQLALKN